MGLPGLPHVRQKAGGSYVGTWGQGKWWVRGRLNHTLRSDSSPLWGSGNPITAHLPYSQWKTCLTQNPERQDRSLGHLPGEEARGCTGSFMEPHRLLPDGWCLLVTISHPTLVPHSSDPFCTPFRRCPLLSFQEEAEAQNSLKDPSKCQG